MNIYYKPTFIRDDFILPYINCLRDYYSRLDLRTILQQEIFATKKLLRIPGKFVICWLTVFNIRIISRVFWELHWWELVKYNIGLNSILSKFLVVHAYLKKSTFGNFLSLHESLEMQLLVVVNLNHIKDD